jgi:hypothetical protein
MARRTWLVTAVAIAWWASAPNTRADAPTDLVFLDGFQPHSCDAEIGAYGSEATALYLGEIPDCDDSGIQRQGVLGVTAETDVYRFLGTDESFCSVEPTVSLSASNPVRLCVFFECVNDFDGLTCPAGSSPVTSPGQRPGCCATGTTLSIEVSDFTCSGADDADVYIRLDTATAACTTYTVNALY